MISYFTQFYYLLFEKKNKFHFQLLYLRFYKSLEVQPEEHTNRSEALANIHNSRKRIWLYILILQLPVYITNISILPKMWHHHYCVGTILLKTIGSNRTFFVFSIFNMFFLVSCPHNRRGFPTILVLVVLKYMFTMAEFIFPQNTLWKH